MWNVASDGICNFLCALGPGSSCSRYSEGRLSRCLFRSTSVLRNIARRHVNDKRPSLDFFFFSSGFTVPALYIGIARVTSHRGCSSGRHKFRDYSGPLVLFRSSAPPLVRTRVVCINETRGRHYGARKRAELIPGNENSPRETRVSLFSIGC